MTPEAVIYRYLEAANEAAANAAVFVRLLCTDADLLGRWVALLKCPVDPAALLHGVRALDQATFGHLAYAQAWAGLPVSGSARVSLEQWRNVLRAACFAELLAKTLGLADPEAVRLRVLLAISGVNVPHDPIMEELLEFRGTATELLEDASTLIKLFAVVDTLEVRDTDAAAAVAQELLNVEQAEFIGLLPQADAQMESLLVEINLVGDLDEDWADRLWAIQQVSMLGVSFSEAQGLEDLYEAHCLAARSLFGAIPYLLVLDQRRGALVPIGEQGVGILLSSHTSVIASSLRDGQDRTLTNMSGQAVGDRQVLRRLGVAEGVCVPMQVSSEHGVEQIGALVFAVDEDGDQDIAIQAYAAELAKWVAHHAPDAGDALDLVRDYRSREEKRMREIVHEANNPLSIVHNYLHILELRLQHEPSAIEQLQMIGSELKRAGDIFQRVRELPEVTEVEAQAQVIFADCNVNELAERVFELHRGYAQDHNVDLHLDLAAGSLAVTSDEQRLAQILNNLVRNAIEACPGQSVTVASSAGVFREGHEGVEISVRDTGPGLARAVLDRLAEPKQSTKGGDHAGLGLHIVHRLVSELKSSIDVRTSSGVGTTFTVHLPLKPL
ncbi:MAG: HAMP domain-containing sensor histidine kinase [Gammaproteobacteria bacterium]|nr:HAMP domain-containing sensor histidine kinase [Gammaproteobacteria bacterium]